jgi:hypothetical protein
MMVLAAVVERVGGTCNWFHAWLAEREVAACLVVAFVVVVAFAISLEGGREAWANQSYIQKLDGV